MTEAWDVPGWLWVATLMGLVGVIIVDLIIVDRRPHAFGPKEAARWVMFYVALAGLFAIFISVYFGPPLGAQFVAGYLMEYSLSVDNLFVFMVIMSAFAVPSVLQHRVLLVGIVIALILRGVLILLGAELIDRFSGTFYLFGAFLLFTAWKVWRSEESEPDPQGNGFMRWVGTRIPTSTEYDGTKLLTRVSGRRALTPMAMVMLAIGTTDLLFALDSIPAVFGITSEAYIVFTVNAFALMGLRQLYFLLEGMLSRLVFLNRGLAIVLGFIGVKLVLEAIDATTSLPVPHVPVWLSLAVIVGVLSVTAAVSLYATRESARGPGDRQR
ncbi:MAG: TerC family protein [Candidatus Nanopelagicales bacterium]|nr:TerC family protein [Candidatus Nanopelagicales bacterium]MCF8536581.1 TerC family protein [Candidatus Nanopelagicales bacterium]MCF8541614.1 TerC family protein [Candidatus Nanopelagicales bacterium]MCF8556248.1 TerC family protein [Candidatus Nanopelagicales bacterium]